MTAEKSVPMDTNVAKNADDKKSEATVDKSTSSKSAAGEADATETNADTLLIEEIREQVRHIEKSVLTKEPHFMARVVRSLLHIQRRLNYNVLHQLVLVFYQNTASKQRTYFMKFLPEPPTATTSTVSSAASSAQQTASDKPQHHHHLLPEVEIYLHLLLLLYLININHGVSSSSANAAAANSATSATVSSNSGTAATAAPSSASGAAPTPMEISSETSSKQSTQRSSEKPKQCSELLMERLCDYNRRSLDMLAARCYFYHSWCYEKSGQLDAIRPFLHHRLRVCILRKDHDGQAVLINLLLRNYLAYNLFDQANHLVSRTTFPAEPPNNELARYLYYQGRIKAVQLEYSAAHQHLVSALRKAPQHAHVALGFKQTVHKLAIVVQLLLGDMPDRSVFRTPTLKHSLAPYLQLTQAVRAGDLAKFNDVLKHFHRRFVQDLTYNLIVRLRHNVIKAGVRRISLSYSCISLEKVATKLQLGSPEDAEFIIAKAIKDGVINAVIDHEKSCVTTKETQDVYSTAEPLHQFHQRVEFCLDVRNQSVKAMRYPPKHYKDLETLEERRVREQNELESAKDLSEEDFDGFS